MARPKKIGLDYFPMDVDFLRDIKIRKIEKECGSESIKVLLCLLGNIYRDEGYYINWDEDTAFLISDEIGLKEEVVKEVVNKSLQVGFFSKYLFDEENILTSKGIQERYLEAKKKSKGIVIDAKYTAQREFMELNSPITTLEDEFKGVNSPKTRVNEEITGVNSPISTQSKVKESKGKESKVKESKQNPLQQILTFYNENISPVTPFVREEIEFDCKDFGYELVQEALRRTVLNSKTSYKYSQAILRDWKSKNYKTLEDVETTLKRNSNQQNVSQKDANTKSSAKVPDWHQETQKDDDSNRELTPEEIKELFGEDAL
ncbi:hypothetical protein BG262_02735 [Floricoccus penangensis]|uniref:DnaD domain-containing protein n=1 Tax=Floricoccus penangensis TaxID=1859475 RepID=A0A9Q5NZT2_9LACT|nr:Lin1244/Lin1753 domain-containing protein [Floricoccus penangensis]OFI46732.1 hypothetical protein BG262_02735 [Floricoccus penangensis]